MNKHPNNEVSLEILAARFAYASTAVTTLADMLATISAGLALRLLEEAASTNSNLNSNGNGNLYSNRNSSSSSNSSNNSMFSFEVEQMQRQMDELIREMKRLKRMMQV